MQLLILLLAFYCCGRIWFWFQQGRRIVDERHVPPPPSLTARVTFYAVCWLARFAFLGRLQIVGRENLSNFAGRFVVTPNHQNVQDTMSMVLTMCCRPTRYMVAVESLQGPNAMLAAWTGGISVHRPGKGHGRSKGAASILKAVRALEQDRRADLVIFPQGKFVSDNVLRREEFEAGAVVIARKAMKETGQPFALLPVMIRYEHSPERAGGLQRLMHRVGWHGFGTFFGAIVYGAKIEIGAPISLESLPTDAKEATDVLFTRLWQMQNNLLIPAMPPEGEAP